MWELFNQTWSKDRRRQLRSGMTEPEWILWRGLRNNALGVKFRRQQGGPYIVDFYAAAVQLVIEIDGDSHFDVAGMAYDADRDAYMRGHGIVVRRFTNDEVREHRDGVLVAIQSIISPPAKGESEGV